MSLQRSRKRKVKVSNDGRKEYSGRTELNGRDKIDSGEVDGSKVRNDEDVEMKNYQKISKSKKTIRSLDFFTHRGRLAFNKLR